MPLTLYYMEVSPPCRTVMLVASTINVDLDLKHVDVHSGEHLKPEFLKLNPHHRVPTLVDDGFVIGESRAIAKYLINKYGKGSKLYPEDPKTRALIDQRLDFDLATLYQSFYDYFVPQLFAEAPADEKLLKKIEEALGYLDAFLEGYKYAAGDQLTLADLVLATTVGCIEAGDIGLSNYPNVVRWFKQTKDSLPHYEKIHGGSLQGFRDHISQK